MKRLVLIGYGNIARMHIQVFRELGADIVASCNRSEEKNTLAKTESLIPKTYTDIHKMIDMERPDGIIICVSFWQMYSVLKEVIPYRIPILAEKPTATSWELHLELLTLSQQYGTPVMVGLNRRHYSVLSKALAIAGGRDSVTSVLVEWSESPNHLQVNRKLTDEQIRSYIFGNSIHGIDLMLWIGGEIINPAIVASELGDPFRWMMSVSGKSNRGGICNFVSSWDNPVPWRVSFASKGKYFVMAPLEKCIVVKEGDRNPVEIEADEIDKRFKAGFFKQAELFINNEIAGYDISSVSETMKLAHQLTSKFK